MGGKGTEDNHGCMVLIVYLNRNSYHLLHSFDEGLSVPADGSLAVLMEEVVRRVHPEDKERLERLFASLSGGEVRLSVMEGEALYGWYQVSFTSIEHSMGDDGDVLLTIQNIDQRKLMDEQLLNTLKTSELASHAKTDFLSRMSHDIRTPINGIIGMTEIARSVSGNPAKTEDCLNKIKLSSEYLLMLINNILDMNKIELGKMERSRDVMQIEEITERLYNIYALEAERKKIKFEINTVDITYKAIIGDKLWIYQILNNLLSNAFKFVREGGNVRLTIRQDRVEQGRVYFLFSVTDDGTGISKEFTKLIFEPYEQDKSVSHGVEGTGLGLSICKCLVSMMEGTINVRSEEGKGTEFDVLLPLELLEGCQEAAYFADPDFKEYDFRGKRILLVEDNELNIEIAEFFLGEMGIIVETAVNGQEAVDRVRENRDFDLILMDVIMPVMDGLEATRTIRSLSQEKALTVPIIAMTANAFREDIRHCMEAGMNAHIAKPFEKEAVYSVLSRWL